MGKRMDALERHDKNHPDNGNEKHVLEASPPRSIKFEEQTVQLSLEFGVVEEPSCRTVEPPEYVFFLFFHDTSYTTSHEIREID